MLVFKPSDDQRMSQTSQKKGGQSTGRIKKKTGGKLMMPQKYKTKLTNG